MDELESCKERDDHKTVYATDDIRKKTESFKDASDDLNSFLNWRNIKPKYLYPHPEIIQKGLYWKWLRKNVY